VTWGEQERGKGVWGTVTIKSIRTEEIPHNGLKKEKKTWIRVLSGEGRSPQDKGGRGLRGGVV